MAQAQQRFKEQIDWLSIFLYFILVVWGWMSVYAADYDEAHKAVWDFSRSYGKQIIWILISAVLGMIILFSNHRIYEAFAYVFYGLSVIFLILVLIFGREISGSKSWFSIGGFGIQPSEFAKLGVCLGVAKYMTRLDFSIRKMRNNLVLAFLIGVPALLILLQGDTGSALVFSAFLLLLFREGLNPFFLIIVSVVGFLSLIALLAPGIWVIYWMSISFLFLLVLLNRKYLGAVTLIFLSGIFLVVSLNFFVNRVLKPHQQKRVQTLLNPNADPMGSGWNVLQSKVAIASGGFTGKGFLKGTQTKLDFVPKQSTDFIFCTVGEEYGFIGTWIMIILFGTFLWRLLYLSENSKDDFTRIYGYGVTMILFFHFTVNVLMTMGLAPVIGIPLPFFSYGGSSMIAFSLMVFILIKLNAASIHRLAV